jgi:hypothetical protein
MTASRFAARLWLAGCAVLAAAGAGEAQTFISATGNDVNICSRTAPCRTLQRGIDATGSGRELQVLNPGEYGVATIAKSITISAVGVSATVRSLAAGSTAITINNPSAVVVLRGLFVSGGGTGRRGIEVLDAAAVHILDCEVERFTDDGINAQSVATELYVRNTIARDNGRIGLLIDGIVSPNAKVSIEDSRFQNNLAGIHVGHIEALITRTVMNGNAGNGMEMDDGRAEISQSTAANNGVFGFTVSNGAQVTVDRSVARNNAFGGIFVSSLAGSRGRISNSVFTDNTMGVRNEGTVETRGNNTVAGNGTNVFNPGALVPIVGN